MSEFAELLELMYGATGRVESAHAVLVERQRPELLKLAFRRFGERVGFARGGGTSISPPAVSQPGSRPRSIAGGSSFGPTPAARGSNAAVPTSRACLSLTARSGGAGRRRSACAPTRTRPASSTTRSASTSSIRPSFSAATSSSWAARRRLPGGTRCASACGSARPVGQNATTFSLGSRRRSCFSTPSAASFSARPKSSTARRPS